MFDVLFISKNVSRPVKLIKRGSGLDLFFIEIKVQYRSEKREREIISIAAGNGNIGIQLQILKSYISYITTGKCKRVDYIEINCSKQLTSPSDAEPYINSMYAHVDKGHLLCISSRNFNNYHIKMVSL